MILRLYFVSRASACGEQQTEQRRPALQQLLLRETLGSVAPGGSVTDNVAPAGVAPAAVWETALRRAAPRGTSARGGIAAEGSTMDWVAAQRAVSRRQDVWVGGFATEVSTTGGSVAGGVAVALRQAAGGIAAEGSASGGAVMAGSAAAQQCDGQQGGGWQRGRWLRGG